MQIPPKRPRTLIVLGVTHLILTGLGTLAMISSTVMMTHPEAMATNLIVQTFGKDPWFAAYYQIYMAIGYASLAVLGVSALGLMRGKKWAWQTTILWAVFSMASTPYNAWVTHQHVIRPKLAQLRDLGDASLKADMHTAMVLPLILGVVITLAYGTLVVIMLCRPKVVAWCCGTGRGKQAAI
jgi:hypothetical protein